MASDLIGNSINQYRITSQIIESGPGTIYKGTDTRLSRDVILRIIPDSFLRLPDFESRFPTAVRSVARLNHPGIAKTVDYGKYGDRYFIVTEYMGGETLAAKLANAHDRHEFLPQPEIIQISRQLALAIHYANQQGILNIDIQPAKIICKPGGNQLQPVISDLGLAWLVYGDRPLQDWITYLAPGYLSPEQALEKFSDCRSDVYRVGVLLYQLATMRLPYPAKTNVELVECYRKESPRPPHQVRHTLSENIEKIILKALQKDPDARYPDLAVFADALDKVLIQPDNIPPAVPVKQTPQRKSEKIPPTQPLTDCVIVETEDGKPEFSVPLKQGEMSIGRGKAADIPLNSLGVSRDHARMVFDGQECYLIDLGSTNGTFLNDGKLLSGVRELWTSNQVARIGPFILRLVRGAKAAATAKQNLRVSQIYMRDGSLAEQKHVHLSSGEGRIGVVLEEDDLRVGPGECETMTVVLRNLGETVDHFRVGIEGIPSEWVTVQPQSVNLMPGNQGSLQVLFRPPRAPTSKAGIYDLTIGVSSRAEPDQKVEVIANLTVLPFFAYDAELHPSKIRTNQKGRVTITNQSNQRESFLLTLKDDADELVFTPAQTKTEIVEGQRGAIEFFARTRRFQLWRKEVSHAYKATLAGASGEAKRTFNGELISSGLLPVWFPVVALLLCAGLAVVASFGIKAIINNSKATATPTPAVVVSATLPFVVSPMPSTPEATSTPAETPTATAIVCGGMVSQNFNVGDKISVVAVGGLHIYDGYDDYPDHYSATIPKGTQLTIQDVPQCVTNQKNGYQVLLWSVKGAGYNGWVVESDTQGYLIQPAK